MEMDGVAPENEGLANISKFDTIDTRGSRLVAGAMHNDYGTVLIIGRSFWVSLILDVAS